MKLYSHEILRATVGSTAHGLALEGTDDLDQMGVCIESKREALGVGSPFEQHIYRTATERTGDPNARSQPGDLDLTVFSLRKFLRLALKGNPTVLVPLFASGAALVHADEIGLQLQSLAPIIVSRRALGAFLGYLMAQKQRLLGERGMKVSRPELVKRYGYDTKFAMHALRLGYQGEEMAQTGRLSLPMPDKTRSLCMAVRRGELSKAEVIAELEVTERALRSYIEDPLSTPALRAEPDTRTVEDWMLGVYITTWVYAA